MYEAFYKFRERPFSLTPDPEYMFLAEHHRSALTLLEYGISQQAPIMLVTGEVGCGKTTLVRYLLNRLDEKITFGLVANVGRNFSRLLQWVCMAYGLSYKGLDDAALYDAFSDFLITQYAADRSVLLVVDEAQNLGPALLEDLRVLTNINADKHVVLQILLVGQPELRTTIQHPSFSQFAQRISVDTHIGTLSLEETRNYIGHRLRVADGEVSLFRRVAIEQIWRASRGVPRLINQLCEACLVYGFAGRVSRIDLSIIEEVLRDKSSTGLFKVDPNLASKLEETAEDAESEPAPADRTAIGLPPVAALPEAPQPETEPPHVDTVRIRKPKFGRDATLAAADGD